MKSCTFILCLLASGCGFSLGGNGDDAATTPTVLSNRPSNGATGVALNGTVSATFSEKMDPETLTASSFTLTSGDPAVAVPGTVIYADSTAVFVPSVDLVSAGLYTATITTEANSDAGVALGAEYSWTFTGDRVFGPGGPPVMLGTAGTYVVLAAASISGTGATATGNLGVSPMAATYITGFSLMLDASTQFSTSTQVTGRVYAADYGVPTPATLGTAINDMMTAYADAAGRAPGVTWAGGANISGQTLSSGVYRCTGALSIQNTVTLAGSATDVWIFQITETMDMAASTSIVLTGGALPKNVFWKVTGAVTLGASAHLEGVVLAATAVTSGAGTMIKGRVLSQTDVTITGSVLVQPAL